MSVVVAIKKDGIVYMGADSQVSRGGTRMTLSNPNNYKIWSLCDVDRSLMGSVGSLRTNNIIKVADNLVPETIDIKDAVDFRFVVKSLVPHLMDELNEYSALSKDRDDMPNMDSEFLEGYVRPAFESAFQTLSNTSLSTKDKVVMAQKMANVFTNHYSPFAFDSKTFRQQAENYMVNNSLVLKTSLHSLKVPEAQIQSVMTEAAKELGISLDQSQPDENELEEQRLHEEYNGEKKSYFNICLPELEGRKT